MCTYTWLPQSSGAIVTMNRDERRERPEGDKITTLSYQQGSLQVYYPIDKQAGGTWFGYNTAGLCLALLNRYQDAENQSIPEAVKRSRGDIIPHLLKCASLPHVIQQIETNDFSGYPAFDLMFTDGQELWQLSHRNPQQKPVLQQHASDLPFMLTSSSVAPEVTFNYRHHQFTQFLKHTSKTTAEFILEHFHLVQTKGLESESVLMSRDLSHTKSICQIDLGAQSYFLRYLRQPEFARAFASL
ncbi:hypothetical protein C2869_06535 [Saccharobesus litoralis]|uniref:Transport and Golgi organization protein 2 n=1 Tax=Saccharobesus litoralis TaxID=2172099 RepID=A0A2S0VPH0_9ALTE|nr:NRDE family protein [Saccharobesus litoralis]AWB66117.1 hypothetical protein C2869_06535 [Saccharobesus litoralis]